MRAELLLGQVSPVCGVSAQHAVEPMNYEHKYQKSIKLRNRGQYGVINFTLDGIRLDKRHPAGDCLARLHKLQPCLFSPALRGPAF